MQTKRMIKIIWWLGCATVGGLSILWITGYFASTVLGFDVTAPANGVKPATMSTYHLFWPGNGSLWVGSVRYETETDLKRLEIDAAADFLNAPDEGARPTTLLQQIGFWLILGRQIPELDRSIHHIVWIGVPGWLPILLLIPILAVLRRNLSGERVF